jgi:hypothetical protein
VSLSRAAWLAVRREAKRQRRSVSQIVELWIEQVGSNGHNVEIAPPSAPALAPALEEVAP